MLKKILSTIFITLGIVSCSADNANMGINTANGIREIAVEENKIIMEYCIPRYDSAKTVEDVQATDKVCLPAKASYQGVKSAWISLVLILEQSKHSNEDNSDKIQEAAMELIRSLDGLHKTLEMMK